jgi:hypothetical protein
MLNPNWPYERDLDPRWGFHGESPDSPERTWARIEGRGAAPPFGDDAFEESERHRAYDFAAHPEHIGDAAQWMMGNPGTWGTPAAWGDFDAAPAPARHAHHRHSLGHEFGRPGAHSGKGPRGWTRSDSRILEDVAQRLMDDPNVDASDVEIEVKDGEVILEGFVPDRWQRRHADAIAESVSGVRDVINRLRVSGEQGTRTPSILPASVTA